MRWMRWQFDMLVVYFLALVPFISAKYFNTEGKACKNDFLDATDHELCYKVYSEPMYWWDAYYKCVDERSFMLQFQDEKTILSFENLLKNILATTNITDVWLGLIRLEHYYQWVGFQPQLFRPQTTWGLKWNSKEPVNWNGCGALQISSGTIRSKSCDKKKLPFVCVQSIENNLASLIDSHQDIDVQIVAFHDRYGRIPLNGNILWVEKDDSDIIMLQCQVSLNGELINVNHPQSSVKIVWVKNGIHMDRPRQPAMYPKFWLYPSTWSPHPGRIPEFLGTYNCEANLPFQTSRYHSQKISLFIKGMQTFKYTIKTKHLNDIITPQIIEPTTSPKLHLLKAVINNTANEILPTSSNIKWMLHYFEPLNEHDLSSGYVISLFVIVTTQSKLVEETLTRLRSVASKRNYLDVNINITGKCEPEQDVINSSLYTWDMNYGYSRGFSDPICVSNIPNYRMVSRRCMASYNDYDRWEDFDMNQCTSKITHLLEDYFCPSGHKMVNNDFCVTNGSTNSTWKDARDECISKGSHLPHNSDDIFATDEYPVASWSVARLNGRRVYPRPTQNFTGQNLTECVVLTRSQKPQRAVCSHQHSFICLSRVQDTLWRVPWCPRGGWLGSEIPELRNTCYFINTSLILSDKKKELYCAEKRATAANTSDPLLHILISATVRPRQTKFHKRSLDVREIADSPYLVDIPFLVCQKPKATRSPRKAKLVLKSIKHKSADEKYKIVELICYGVNVRPNSRIVWYHNGDPYPVLEKLELKDVEHLAAARVELNESRQGDYWCEAWDNNAQSTVSSNKITLTVDGINNCVIVLNTGNSTLAADVFELSSISNFFNKAESNIVRREVTLLANGEMVIWVHGNSHRSQEEVVSDVRKQFEEHVATHNFALNLPSILVRHTEWCLQETTESPNGRKLVWPETKRNQASLPKELCSTIDGNPVFRECLGDFRQGAFWGPIIGACLGQPNEFTQSLYNLSEREVTKNNAYESSVSLDELTESKDTNNYRPVDIAYIAKTMQKISETGNVTNETLRRVVDTVDRVMKVESYKLLESQQRSRSSNKITQSLERMIDSVPLEQGIPLQISLSNIYVEAHLLTEPEDIIVGVASYDNEQQKTLTSAEELDYSHTDAALILPMDLIEERKNKSGSEGLKISFVVYHNSKLFPTKNATVNSKVVAAKLQQPVQDYPKPIQLIFKPLQEMSLESVSCTYWDPRLNSGRGDWSTAGCRLHSIDGQKIECHCYHLTNFAVLMDMYGQESRISGTHRHILDAITYIGCALSIFGLSLTILTFLLFSKWRKKDGNKIVCNLALALLLLLVVFLAGIEQTHSPALCQAVAVLLHYFILSSFCWMLVEAIQQYLLFVRVLDTYIPRFLLKAMIFAWGLPLIIVVTVIGIDIGQYSGGQHYCWMKLDALYYAFLLPVGVIMFVNSIVFILVLRGITCARGAKLRSNQSKQQLMKTQLFAAICIFVLLGLTWLFGFLAIDEARIIFQYIFCVCNSMQGLLIFVFMVVRDRNAHDLWTSLCSSKKTQKKRGTTSGLQTTRREEGNMSENFTTKLMISRTSTHSPL